MKILLILVVVAAASASGPTATSSTAEILCQAFLGDIPLCSASSCWEIANTKLSATRNGFYWLTNGHHGKTKAFCQQNITPDPSPGWMRAGYFKSTTTGCPDGLEAVVAGGRTLCRKKVNVGCSSVTFPSHGISYSRVCGLVYGYIKSTADGFEKHGVCVKCTIDQPYMDGVSITHGSPRQHIWTLAAAGYSPSQCPCGDNSRITHIPLFIGGDYFCDAEGKNTYTREDRLWDGQSCSPGGEQCCSRANWFCRHLDQPTTDDIEFRVCTDQYRGDEDVYIEEAGIFVQ